MVIELNILNIIPQLQLLHHKSDSLYPYTAMTPKNMYRVHDVKHLFYALYSRSRLI